MSLIDQFSNKKDGNPVQLEPNNPISQNMMDNTSNTLPSSTARNQHILAMPFESQNTDQTTHATQW